MTIQLNETCSFQMFTSNAALLFSFHYKKKNRCGNKEFAENEPRP